MDNLTRGWGSRLGRVGRLPVLAALILLAMPLIPGLTPLTLSPAAAAALSVRWAFYVTYNPNSLVSLQAHADQLNYVSPWFYTVDGNGSVNGTAQPAVNDLLRARSIKNLPMVRNSAGYSIFHDVLRDPAKRDSIIAQLRNLVLDNGYDGITIDFEAINGGDEALLTAFMSSLYQDFKAHNKLVAMAVPPKTRDANTGWAGAYNYHDLSRSADYFIVMAYDQHYAGGQPGPIAPMPWLNDVANYASATLGSGKIIWGIGVYGYDWNTSFTPRKPADPRTFGETQALSVNFAGGGGIIYDAENQAPSLIYLQDNQRHEVWYEDKQSFGAKIGLVQGRNFLGFALWRLGQEDPGVWDTIGSLRGPCDRIAAFTSSQSRVYFAQTGHSLGGGFLTYWRSTGGLPVYGYPLTEEFTEVSRSDGRPYTVQYFERNRFEWHPELRDTPYEFEIGLLGVQYTANQTFALIDPFPDTPTKIYFAQTGHSLGGGFLEYWRAHGGLTQFGYPISEEMSERSLTDGQVYRVQYFQRARLEWHPQLRSPNSIQLGLLGVWALQAKGCTP
ncbi:MAG: glycosyl hydrolase family 18 protein [Chloroflexia bacterium]